MTHNDNIKPNQAPLFDYHPYKLQVEVSTHFTIDGLLRWFRRREELMERLRRERMLEKLRLAGL